MIYKRFSVQLAFRLAALGALAFSSIWLLIQPGYVVAPLLLALLFGVMAFDLWRLVQRTNRDLVRFLDSAKFADFSQRFASNKQGAGFNELGHSLNNILEQLRGQRAESESEVQRLTALIEHIPVPLLTRHSDGSLSLQNNAARRMFSSSRIQHLDDLKEFGEYFHRAIAAAVPGKREMVTFSVEGMDYQLMLSASEVVAAGEKSHLVSLQNIQSELDVTQAQAWQDLVRVLTHEIMNSITPITSLASTSLDVVNDLNIKSKGTALEKEVLELQDAIETIARRSDNLMQFVDSYRQLQRVAPPEKAQFKVESMFNSVQKLAAAEWPDMDSWLCFDIEPKSLELNADPVLLEPVLLNLLRNAQEATCELEQPQVFVKASLNGRGSAVIDVSDNGAGVDDDIAKKIFVPFFTTKQDGSGVGLALARQVMTAHGGFIRVSPSDTGGAKFSLTF